MQIQIRRNQEKDYIVNTSNLFQWQPPGSQKWYNVRRGNIYVFTGRAALHKEIHWSLVREFFNRLNKGETLQVRARYFRVTKNLVIDYNGGEK